jgi:hypothetical protein
MTPITRVSADGLSRERWQFTRQGSSRDDRQVVLVLVGYSIERRAVAKGRFLKAETRDTWSVYSDRRFLSKLPQPATVPDDVLDEAASQITVAFYIGWSNEESRLTDRPRAVGAAELGEGM